MRPETVCLAFDSLIAALGLLVIGLSAWLTIQARRIQ